MIVYQYIDSPVAPLLLAADDHGLRLVEFHTPRHSMARGQDWSAGDHPTLQAARVPLEEYFADFKTQAQTDFDTWFDSLQDVLDENTAGNLLNMITALSARVDLIEAVVFNDITENPFLILFDDLSGVNTTGVWNESLQRIEC